MLRTLTAAINGDSLQLAEVELLGEEADEADEADEAAVLIDDVSVHRCCLVHGTSLPPSLLLLLLLLPQGDAIMRMAGNVLMRSS